MAAAAAGSSENIYIDHQYFILFLNDRISIRNTVSDIGVGPISALGTALAKPASDLCSEPISRAWNTYKRAKRGIVALRRMRSLISIFRTTFRLCLFNRLLQLLHIDVAE